MFDICIELVLAELDNYIKRKTASKEEVVIFASIGNVSKESERNVKGKLFMSVVDIASEDLGSRASEYIPQGNGYIARNQGVKFSLYLLISINMHRKNLEGLGYLAQAAAFFQSKNYFSRQNTPVLQEANMDSLSVELIRLSNIERQALWDTLGVPYVPSLLYKVGVISIEDGSSNFDKVPIVRKPVPSIFTK